MDVILRQKHYGTRNLPVKRNLRKMIGADKSEFDANFAAYWPDTDSTAPGQWLDRWFTVGRQAPTPAESSCPSVTSAPWPHANGHSREGPHSKEYREVCVETASHRLPRRRKTPKRITLWNAIDKNLRTLTTNKTRCLPILNTQSIIKARFFQKQNLASEEGDEKLMITSRTTSDSVHSVLWVLLYVIVQAPQNSLAKNQEFHRNLHLSHKESSLYLQKCNFFFSFFGGYKFAVRNARLIYAC